MESSPRKYQPKNKDAQTEQSADNTSQDEKRGG
jgi:hypothetical protein